MKRRMTDYAHFLENEIELLQKNIDVLPPGKLLCARDRNHMKWYVRNTNGMEYLPKKERSFAEQLALKRFYEEKLEEYLAELSATQYYLNHSRDLNKVQSKFYAKHSNFIDLLSKGLPDKSDDVKKWLAEDYRTNPYKLEKKTHKADGGVMMRSKSEALIATKFYHAGIPFRYEAELIVGGNVYYPDFTILKVKTGETVYHEHFGMMDDKNYVERVAEKIKNYEAAGIIMGKNLTATFECSDSHVRMEEVDVLIDRLKGY